MKAQFGFVNPKYVAPKPVVFATQTALDGRLVLSYNENTGRYDLNQDGEMVVSSCLLSEVQARFDERTTAIRVPMQKLVFTTSAPHSLIATAVAGLEPPPPLVKSRKSKIEGEGHLQVYIDGKAGGEAGFDIPYLIEGTLVIKDHDGTPCIVELPDKKIDCLLFAWKTDSHIISEEQVKRQLFKGLIVATDDQEAIQKAKEAMARRTAFL